MKEPIYFDSNYEIRKTFVAVCPDCGQDMVVDTGHNGAWAENEKYVIIPLICPECGSTGVFSILFDAPHFNIGDGIPF